MIGLTLLRGFKDELEGGNVIIPPEVMAVAEAKLNISGQLAYIKSECEKVGLKSAIKKIAYLSNL